jgi:hypothetical protein
MAGASPLLTPHLPTSERRCSLSIRYFVFLRDFYLRSGTDGITLWQNEEGFVRGILSLVMVTDFIIIQVCLCDRGVRCHIQPAGEIHSVTLHPETLKPSRDCR